MLQSRRTSNRTSGHRAAAAVALLAALLAIPASAGASDYPSARQVAAHQGRLADYIRSTRPLDYPNARQVAIHADRLEEYLRSTPTRFPSARRVAIHAGRLPTGDPVAAGPSSSGDGASVWLVVLGALMLATLGALRLGLGSRGTIRHSPTPGA